MNLRVAAWVLMLSLLQLPKVTVAHPTFSAAADSLVNHPDSVLALVDENSFRFDSTFSFKGTATYNNGEQQQSFGFSVRMLRDSLTWVSLNVGGIEAARALFTKDSVKLNLPLSGEKMLGDYSLLQSYMQYPLSFDMLNSLLLGGVVNTHPSSGAVTENDTAFAIYLESAKSYQKSEALKKDYILFAQLLKDKLTMRELRATFGHQETVGSRLFSHSRNYELSAGGSKATLLIKVNRTELNKPLRFPF